MKGGFLKSGSSPASPSSAPRGSGPDGDRHWDRVWDRDRDCDRDWDQDQVWDRDRDRVWDRDRVGAPRAAALRPTPAAPCQQRGGVWGGMQ